MSCTYGNGNLSGDLVVDVALWVAPSSPRCCDDEENAEHPARVDFVSVDDDEEGPVAEGSFRSFFFFHKKGT